ncbi:MAG: hypothetical protein KBD76_02800 [Bacteriovorax sp.]|jgi:hypothetical protein|nr:hypothetical protein [Bacteriovorax sp.]
MNYDLRNDSEGLSIPPTAYQKIKRCPSCQSVFITDTECEACGRSLLYHPIGSAFGPKSFYGIKERYLDGQYSFIRFFPLFESRHSTRAKSYVRFLSKRFSDLVSAFNTIGIIEDKERKLFYAEAIEIIDELLRYRLSAELMSKLLEENDNSLEGRELFHYLQIAKSEVSADESWVRVLLDYRLWGILRLESFFKLAIILSTMIAVAMAFKDLINSQFGK